MKVRPIFFLVLVFSLHGNFLPAQLSPHHDTIITRWLNEADQYQEEKKFSKMLTALDSALVHSGSSNTYSTSMDIHFRKAKFYESTRLGNKAFAAMHAALVAARQADSTGLQLAALDSLVQFSLRSKKFEEAYNYKTQWMMLRDTLNEGSANLAYARHANTVDSLNAEIATVRKALGVAGNANLKQRYKMETYGIAAGGLLLLLLVVVFILIVRTGRQSKKRIKEIDENLGNLKSANETIDKLVAKTAAQEKAIARLESGSTELWELVPTINQRLKTGTGQIIADAHIQLEQLGRSAGNALPVEKYLELQNTLARAAKELRDTSAHLDSLYDER